MTLNELRATIEALIFLSGDAISIKELAALTHQTEATVDAAVRELALNHYNGGHRGIRLVEIGKGWQFNTCPDVNPHITRLLGERRGARLSQAALETLAVIAYRQPVTKGDIEQIRGVGAEGVVASLLERELVVELGRKDAPGRPILYGVSDRFLRHFGLRSLDDLPRSDLLNELEPDSGIPLGHDGHANLG